MSDRIAEIVKVMQEGSEALRDRSVGLEELVLRHIPDATIDEIRQAIRSETRRMAFADRVQEFWSVIVCLIEDRSDGDPEATVGDTVPEEEFVRISENYHLVATGDGEWRDALQ
jgi:hypothetical protein